jgi:hypothetical protein
MKKIQIHGKDYVMVKDRIIHFNEEYPNGCIRSKMVDRIDNIVIFEATVIPDVDKPERYFTGHAEEEIGSSQINKTSALENCETSAIGRALAMMGIGVDESFASGDEVANAVFQQNQEDATGVSYQNAPKTAVKGLVCPKCGKDVLDKRIEDIDGSKVCQTSPKGKNLPAFRCADNDDFNNPTCSFASWELDEAEAGVLPNEIAPHKRQADKEPVVEEEIPF